MLLDGVLPSSRDEDTPFKPRSCLKQVQVENRSFAPECELPLPRREGLGQGGAPPPDLPHEGGGNLYPSPSVGEVGGGGRTPT
jgi:hypothetical protein